VVGGEGDDQGRGIVGIEQRWAWTIRTGLVFPGSVLCFGSRVASHIPPRLGIRSLLDGGEFTVDAHAFFSHFL
jgi:hypothetical protein